MPVVMLPAIEGGARNSEFALEFVCAGNRPRPILELAGNRKLAQQSLAFLRRGDLPKPFAPGGFHGLRNFKRDLAAIRCIAEGLHQTTNAAGKFALSLAEFASYANGKIDNGRRRRSRNSGGQGNRAGLECSVGFQHIGDFGGNTIGDLRLTSTIQLHMQKYDNGLDDLFGLLRIEGSNNSVIANHISETIDTQYIKPLAAKPVIINVVSGSGNYIANNHIVATTEMSQINDAPNSACFSTQVGALLSTDNLKALEVTAVRVQRGSVRNTVLDSGRVEQVEMDRTVNAFRGTPVPGQSSAEFH